MGPSNANILMWEKSIYFVVQPPEEKPTELIKITFNQ